MVKINQDQEGKVKRENIQILVFVIFVVAVFFAARFSYNWKLDEGLEMMSDYAFQSAHKMRVDSYEQDSAVVNAYAELSSILASVLYHFIRFLISSALFVLIVYFIPKWAKLIVYEE